MPGYELPDDQWARASDLFLSRRWGALALAIESP